MNHAILTAIPHVMTTAAISVKGGETVLHLVDLLVFSDKTAASVSLNLTSVIRGTLYPSVTRATSIKLLSAFLTKHRRTYPPLIKPIIPEIVALALDDGEPDIYMRIAAIRFLAALVALFASDHENHGDTAQADSNVDLLDEITEHATRFIALLQFEDASARSAVVGLLAVLSTNPQVRRTISLSILASGLEQPSSSFVGHVELLALMISDGRFHKEPTDIVMLLVASAFVERSEVSNCQYEVLSALWCRYKPQGLEDRIRKAQDLLNWFTLSLVGRTATEVNEAQTLCKRFEAWLPPKDLGNR
ncbi:hypothetical protein EST38_g13316 [Candolleomyces aberdarensis]|uniref:Clathrin/coatomer adaptor adaptin-like N-terminal domain-containing protein n=1 Tax=Candolleomyces aberdarensis TaxID=2316362 RepID=A0A4Q2D2Z5_9AGAR|nr:hypothetical protein EST38_g13316 [Candolleomyces aberdarensis]